MKKILLLSAVALAAIVLTSCVVKIEPDGKPRATVDREAVVQYASDQVSKGIEKIIRATK